MFGNNMTINQMLDFYKIGVYMQKIEAFNKLTPEKTNLDYVSLAKYGLQEKLWNLSSLQENIQVKNEILLLQLGLYEYMNASIFVLDLIPLITPTGHNALFVIGSKFEIKSELNCDVNCLTTNEKLLARPIVLYELYLAGDMNTLYQTASFVVVHFYGTPILSLYNDYEQYIVPYRLFSCSDLKAKINQINKAAAAIESSLLHVDDYLRKLGITNISYIDLTQQKITMSLDLNAKPLHEYLKTVLLSYLEYWVQCKFVEERV